MTDQEKQMITGLADRMKNAPAPQIDRDANVLIQSTIGSRPDAVYVLTQTVLIQQMALEQTKAQIENLKQQGGGSGGFLPGQSAPPPSAHSGQGFGQSAAPSTGYTGGGYAQSRYSGQAPPPPPQSAQEVVYEEVPRRSGFSDFLHNAAQTAAGVMAGELAFDALSGIFGHRGYGGGGFFAGGGGIVPGSETIVNNYYGDQGGGFDRGGGDSRFADAAASSGDNVSPDIEDDRDRLAGSGSDDASTQGDGSQDDSGQDSSGDDGSSYDASGGDDYSGGDSGGDGGF